MHCFITELLLQLIYIWLWFFFHYLCFWCFKITVWSFGDFLVISLSAKENIRINVTILEMNPLLDACDLLRDFTHEHTLPQQIAAHLSMIVDKLWNGFSSSWTAKDIRRTTWTLRDSTWWQYEYHLFGRIVSIPANILAKVSSSQTFSFYAKSEQSSLSNHLYIEVYFRYRYIIRIRFQMLWEIFITYSSNFWKRKFSVCILFPSYNVN